MTAFWSIIGGNVFCHCLQFRQYFKADFHLVNAHSNHQVFDEKSLRIVPKTYTHLVCLGNNYMAWDWFVAYFHKPIEALMHLKRSFLLCYRMVSSRYDLAAKINKLFRVAISLNLVPIPAREVRHGNWHSTIGDGGCGQLAEAGPFSGIVDVLVEG